MAVENWDPAVAVFQRLQRNDRYMICWIFGVKPKNRSPSSSFLTKLKISDIWTLIQGRRLPWYGNVRRSSRFIKDVFELPLPEGRSRSRPAKTWLSCVKKDMESYGLKNVRHFWWKHRRKPSCRDMAILNDSSSSNPPVNELDKKFSQAPKRN